MSTNLDRRAFLMIGAATAVGLSACYATPEEVRPLTIRPVRGNSTVIFPDDRRVDVRPGQTVSGVVETEKGPMLYVITGIEP